MVYEEGGSNIGMYGGGVITGGEYYTTGLEDVGYVEEQFVEIPIAPVYTTLFRTRSGGETDSYQDTQPYVPFVPPVVVPESPAVPKADPYRPPIDYFGEAGTPGTYTDLPDYYGTFGTPAAPPEPYTGEYDVPLPPPPVATAGFGLPDLSIPGFEWPDLSIPGFGEPSVSGAVGAVFPLAGAAGGVGGAASTVMEGGSNLMQMMMLMMVLKE